MAPRHPSFVTGTLCPQCSADIPFEAPEGLCPSCLFAAAVTAARTPIEDAEKDDGRPTADDEEVDSPQFGFAEASSSALRRVIVFATAAARYQPAPRDPALSLLAWFNRSWAINVLDLALGQVRLDWVAAGRADEFEHLKPTLQDESAADDLESVSLLKRGFHQRLREEVARTVVNPDDVDDETWELFRALQL